MEESQAAELRALLRGAVRRYAFGAAILALCGLLYWWLLASEAPPRGPGPGPPPDVEAAPQ